MRTLMRRIRAALGTGALWGFLGAAVGAGLGVLTGLVVPLPLGAAILNGAAALGLLGFASGTSFAIALSVADGRRTLTQLSAAKSSVLGGVVGAAYSAALLIAAGPPPELAILIPVSSIFAAMAASLAGGSVLIAQRSSHELQAAPGHLLPTRTE